MITQQVRLARRFLIGSLVLASGCDRGLTEPESLQNSSGMASTVPQALSEHTASAPASTDAMAAARDIIVAAGATPATPPDSALDLSGPINDLAARVLPAFGDDAGAVALRRGLSSVLVLARGGQRIEARAVLQATRTALRSSLAGAADLDAVRLTLDAFEHALDPNTP